MLFSFFKKHSGIISKLIVHQLGLAIFGISVIMGIFIYNQGRDEATQNLILILVSGFSVLFYLSLLLIVTNEEGAHDRIRIDGGRMKQDSLLGLKWGLAANSVNLLLAAVIILLSFFDSPVTNGVYNVCHGIAILIQSPFMGLRTALMPYNPIAFLIMPALPIFVCFLGYYIGLQGKLLIPPKKKN